jgi:hypothetical protein
MFERLPSLRGIQLVLNSLGHMQMSIVQQDNDIGEFTVTFVLGLSMQLFRCLAAAVSTDCGICGFHKQGPFSVKEHCLHHFTCRCL